MWNPVFYTRHRQKWSPRMWKGHFYTRQMNPVCKTPCFTHGTGKNEVPVCKKATFAHGKWIPYVKWQVLHTANESRMQNPVFYTRHRQKWSCEPFNLLRVIPPSIAIGHRSASGAIFDAQWNDIKLRREEIRSSRERLYLHRHRGIRVRDDSPFCFGITESCFRTSVRQRSSKLFIVFFFGSNNAGRIVLGTGTLVIDNIHIMQITT